MDVYNGSPIGAWHVQQMLMGGGAAAVAGAGPAVKTEEDEGERKKKKPRPPLPLPPHFQHGSPHHAGLLRTCILRMLPLHLVPLTKCGFGF